MNWLGETGKRLLDVVGAVIGLILLSPLFLVVGMIIKLGSPGPVFFRQPRVGKHGRIFRILKFRSMRPDAEALLKQDQALWDEYVQNDFKLPEGRDPRITPIGRFLRKTSLDELPQLWNVLVGDMSLVGPRPLVQQEIDEWYRDTFTELLSVRPGMTGLWQVSGRSSIAYPERAQIELEYVRSVSFARDLSILARTVAVVLNRTGAH